MVKRSAILVVIFSLTALVGWAGDPTLEFIENRNQWDKGVDYGIRIPGGMLYVDGSGFRYYLYDQARIEELHMASHAHADEATGPHALGEKIDAQYVRMSWKGARDVQPQPFGKNQPYYNYFLGRDPSRHAAGVPSYAGVLYPHIYDGIDLKMYATGANLKYDFIVAPEADPSCIQGAYSGVVGVKLDESGSLIIPTVAGEIIESRPYAYQMIAGERVSVACQYVLRDTVMSFTFPEGYDPCEPLVIDPLLIFSTYSGSTADNWGSTATPGERGRLYSAGVTNLASGGTFPAKPGVFQTSYGGWYDIGILKYDSTGQNLLYASYLGGDDADSPHSLVMDPTTNDLLVLGTTSSPDFPVTPGVLDDTFGGGIGTDNVIQFFNGTDIFVARISADGTKLRASTYFGGASNDGLNDSFAGLSRNYGDELRGDIITDAAGDVYISSVTSSSDLQLINSFSTTYFGGVTDAIVVKFSRDLDQLLWGAFLGGSGADAAYTLKLTDNGDVLVAGGTTSANFPTTPGAYQEAYAGAADGWIARISSDGQALLQGTYTGTSSYDQIYFLDISESEEIYVYGQTADANFPISPGVFSNPNSGQFVQKFSPDLSTLELSTVFGSGRGIPDISPTAFLVNDCNNVYMAGWGGIVNSATNHWPSNTIGMPDPTPDAFQSTTSGSDFYFIVLTADFSEYLYATYLGGTTSRTHVDGGTSRFDKSGIVYHAVCAGCEAFNGVNQPTSDFPTTPGAWSNRNRSQNCNNAAFKFDLASLRARFQTNSVKFDAPNVRRVCLPDGIVFQNRSVGGEIFHWDFGDGTEVVKLDTSMVVHHYPEPGRYLAKLVAIDSGTCAVRDFMQVFIDVLRHEAVIQDDDALCEGSSYRLEASGGSTYHWTSEDGTFVSHEAKPLVEPDTTTRYFVTVTAANGCVLRDTVDLRVVPGVEPEFQIFQRGQCRERPALEVVNLTRDAEDTQMIFDFGDGYTSEQQTDLHLYEQDGLYNVTLRSMREFCVFEKVFPVPVYSVRIPNVITPSATSGYNDKFTILFGEAGEFTPADFGVRVNLVVYNRWGTKVYESSDYQYDWGGEGLPLGTYYYEVSIGDRAVCKSWLEIL